MTIIFSRPPGEFSLSPALQVCLASKAWYDFIPVLVKNRLSILDILFSNRFKDQGLNRAAKFLSGHK